MRNWFLGQLAMYAAYHRDPRNRATHHVGVPMIVFSLMVIASTLPLFVLEVGVVTLATVLIGALLLLYVLNTPLIGVIAVIKYGVLLYVAEWIAGFGMQTALIAFVTLFLVGWGIQFWGHAYEGRKPALFDNLLQIFMAPAFLVAEILFALKLEDALKADIEERMVAFLPEEERAV